MEPLVSVVIPVYNQEKYLSETIESVLAQTFQNFELILLDDGSTDNTAMVIRNFASKDERIVPIFKTNSGRSNALNSIVSIAKGKWCAICDADDLMLPDRLEKQVRFHKDNLLVQASSCNCFYINDKSEVQGVQRYPYLKSIEDCRRAALQNTKVHLAITGMMIARDTYLKCGGLRLEFWPCDDLEFVNRLVQSGILVIIIQDVLMKYRIHPFAITAQQPMKVANMAAFIYHSLDNRKVGKPEITFKEFMDIRQQDSWWIKFNRAKYHYAIMFHRQAHFSVYTKNYSKFFIQMVFAFILSPGYVLATLKNRLILKN
jgi:glycosyltransferase involved in cell wall biosynthesis